MKKIALLLAMLICLTPVLSSCGAQSAPEKVVMKIVEATYEDFDDKTLCKLYYNLNSAMLTDVLGDEEYKNVETFVLSSQNSTKKVMADYKEESKKCKKYDFRYDIRYCEIYNEKDDEFESIVAELASVSNALSDVTDQVAKVRFVGEVFITDEDGEDYIRELDRTFCCYRINGKWYAEFLQPSNT